MARSTKNISVSLDPNLLKLGRECAAIRGFGQSFSSYVAFLIEQDTKVKLPHDMDSFELDPKYVIEAKAKMLDEMREEQIKRPTKEAASGAGKAALSSVAKKRSERA